MANFKDGPGTASLKSSSSCSVRPSFWAQDGRLYLATRVSIVTSFPGLCSFWTWSLEDENKKGGW